jgi:proline racemase/trans-L-3-hydroxyproline dehydratase
VRIESVDYHTAGEPFRIVTAGVEPLVGDTILDKRRDALEHHDHVRRLLVNEPRGHADMYGCFVVEPNDAGADLGVVFFHNAGYSTACGHGTIALVTWALDAGVIARAEGENRIVVDVPSGRLETWALVEDGRVRSVRFRNVPAFVWAEGVELGGHVVDVAFGGAFYASLEERVEPGELPRLIELGRELKREIGEWQDVAHPLEPELRDVYGVIFWQEEGEHPLTQRNVTVFADGEVDRSPCGSLEPGGVREGVKGADGALQVRGGAGRHAAQSIKICCYVKNAPLGTSDRRGGSPRAWSPRQGRSHSRFRGDAPVLKNVHTAPAGAADSDPAVTARSRRFVYFAA